MIIDLSSPLPWGHQTTAGKVKPYALREACSSSALLGVALVFFASMLTGNTLFALGESWMSTPPSPIVVDFTSPSSREGNAFMI